MALDDYKISSWIQSVSSLQDQPNQPPASMTAAQLKAAFDSNSNQLKDALNGLIDELDPQVDSIPPVFCAVQGTTTSAQIEAAYQVGKVILLNSSTAQGILTKRASATKHEFVKPVGEYYVKVVCENSSWSATTTYLLPKDSPNMTGTPKAPTAPAGTDTTQIATTAFVQQEIAARLFVVTYGTTTNADMEAAFTAGKIIVCVYDDRVYANFSRASATDHYIYGWTGNKKYYVRNNNDSWTNSSTELAPKASPTFTGTPKSVTPSVGDSSTKIATTAFVQQEINARIFIATYNTTTIAEIEAAFNAGKMIAAVRNYELFWCTKVELGVATFTAFVPGTLYSNVYYFKVDSDGWDAVYYFDVARKSQISTAIDAAIFKATYSTTTSAEIETAYQANKICYCQYNSRIYYLSYRASSTKHYFTTVYNGTEYRLTCDNNTWSATSAAL